MKKYFLLSIIFLFFTILYAQNTLEGHIEDQETGESIPYVNVFLPEHHMGTLTDKYGNFILKGLPSGKIKVSFSYISYATVIKTLSVSELNEFLTIKMEPIILQGDEVVVSGGNYSSKHENAIKIETIDVNRLTHEGTLNFTEAIASVPGVDMIAKGSGVAKPVIRGLSMTNILMLNNGVKLENFQFSENHPFLIDEFGIDHIEIIKGPASLLYGSDAVGGVINIIKEKPAPNGKIIGDYHLQYHSNTHGIISNLGLKGSSKSFFWNLRGGVKSHADYRDGNVDPVPNTRFNEGSFKATTGFHTSYGLFRVYYDYNRDKLGMCVGDAFPYIIENGRKNEVWYQDLTNHIISTRNTLFLKNYKVDLNAAYQMNNRRLQTDETKPAFEMVDMDLNTFSYEIKTHLPSSLNSEYIVGLQGANKTNQNHDAPNHVIPDANVNDISGFTLLQQGISSKMKLQAGIRYDLRSIEVSSVSIDTNYANISASLGATYRVAPNLLIRANIASAYRTPNLAELTQNGLHGNRYEQGNPQLKSQRSYEADINMHFHSGWLMADISAYYHKINHYIYLSPTNDTTEGGVDIYRYMQNNAILYGGEASIYASPFDWLLLKTGYAYTLGKQEDGTYLPFIPHNKWIFEGTFKKDELMCLKNIFFKIGGYYAAKQSHPAMFETDSESYFILNGGIGTDIMLKDQRISFSILVNNLLNKLYIDHLSTLKDLGYANIGRNISMNIDIPFAIK